MTNQHRNSGTQSLQKKYLIAGKWIALEPAEIRKALTEIYTPSGAEPAGYAPLNSDEELPAIKARVIASSKDILSRLGQ